MFIFVALLVLMWSQDTYHVIQKITSPDRSRIALLIGNYGGGGSGYCRDLIYNFPNSNNIPSITSNWAESRNKKYLVKITNCDDIKKLEWKNNELTWKNKGSIRDYGT